MVNLDLLRILAMIMIVTLHYLGKGGALNTTNVAVKQLAWFIEYLSLIAVNIYVLISSYFLVDSKFRWSKVLKLLVEVWFYSLIILVIGKIIWNDISMDELIHSIFPISTSHYWFITIYLFMYILSPFINILINNMSKRQHFNLIIILTITLSILNFITPIFDTTNGYGIMWFIVLYFISSYIKRYVKVNKSIKYPIIYLLITILLTVLHLYLGKISYKHYLIEGLYNRISGYNNIFILVSSLSLFTYFRAIKINNKILTKIITIISPATFGVYLIHENIILRTRIYSGILNSEKYTYSGRLYFLVILILSVLSIFIICTLIDICRAQLFNILKKKDTSIKPFSKLDKYIDKLMSRM